MKVEEVKTVFDRTHEYLKDNSNIPVRVNLINEMVKTLSFQKYIEVGCGDGSIALSILDDHRELTLLDISDKMIEHAREKTPLPFAHKVEYVVGDIFAFRPRQRFDLVICVGVLAHVSSIEDLLTKIDSMLTENGSLILQFTESHSLFGWFYKLMNRTPGGYKLTKTCYRDLEPLLLKLNLKPVKTVVYCGSRMGLQRLGANYDYRFKLFTSKLHLAHVFSEVIVLLKRLE